MKAFHFFSFEIQCENRFFLSKDDRIWLSTILVILKLIFHTYLLEIFDFFDDDSVLLFERTRTAIRLTLPLKYEKLVLCLLVHDEVFAADDGYPLFVF